MEYGAISIDTSIFDEKGLKLESGVLKTLEQFKGMPSCLVLPEVVVREVQNHLEKKVSEARTSLSKALRSTETHLMVSRSDIEKLSEALIPKKDDSEIAEYRVKTFIDATGATVIPAAKTVTLEDVLNKYFNAEAPFEVAGKKKSEFPDAIALLSLEHWAKSNKTKVLAVAKDGDWKSFADGSDFVDVESDLAQALSIFQPNTSALDFCTYISTFLVQNEPKDLYAVIDEWLSEQVNEIDLIPEASSAYYYEYDYVEVNMNEFKFSKGEEGNALLRAIQGQGDTLIVEAKVWISAEVSTNFSLATHDSIDRDYVTIGNSSPCTDLEFEAELLLAFEGDFDGSFEEVKLVDLELISSPSWVDFGEIEPDYRDGDF